MSVLKYTIVVRHPKTDVPTALLAGQPVPGWASKLVHKDDIAEDDGAAVPESKADKVATIQAASEQS